MTAAIRVVAVGCGWVTVNRHIPAIRRDAGSHLVGVVDRDPARAAWCGRRFGVPAASALDDPALPSFDAVSIGTAPPRHAALALEALRAGKHAIVEKPLAMTPDEANDMVAAARAGGLVLAVVHNFQFARSTSAARAIVDGGRYGRVRGVVGVQLSNPRRRLPVWYRELPAGLFYDESPHLFALARTFLGDARVTSAGGVASSDPADPTPRHVSVLLSSDGAAFGSLSFTFDAAASEWHFAILLERATLVCDLFRDILVTLPDDGRHRPLEILRSSSVATVQHWAGVARSGAGHLTRRLDYGNDEVFRRFAAACYDGGEAPGITGADGAAVVREMHRALERIDHVTPAARG